MVNFRYRGDWMHIARNPRMADSERSTSPALFVGGVMLRFRRHKETETGISGRRRSQDLLMTARIDAKLPERPSLEGYKVDLLSLDQVVHVFRNLAK
jgi:hypothetical protein